MLVNVVYRGIICEIQLLLNYFLEMRKFTHLFYKVVRAGSFWSLVTDLRPSMTDLLAMKLPKGHSVPDSPGSFLASHYSVCIVIVCVFCSEITSGLG